MAHPYAPLQEGSLCLSAMCQERRGDTRRLSITWGELDRAMEGQQPRGRTGICSFVWGGALPETYINDLQRSPCVQSPWGSHEGLKSSRGTCAHSPAPRSLSAVCQRTPKPSQMRAGSQLARIIQYDRFDSGSVMVWWVLSLEGRTNFHVLANGTLTAVRYQDEILRPIVRIYTGAVGPGFLLVQDKSRPHVARVCRRFLDDEGIDAIDWPSRFPDLNPIESLWYLMYRRTRRLRVASQTSSSLMPWSGSGRGSPGHNPSGACSDVVGSP